MSLDIIWQIQCICKQYDIPYLFTYNVGTFIMVIGQTLIQNIFMDIMRLMPIYEPSRPGNVIVREQYSYWGVSL